MQWERATFLSADGDREIYGPGVPAVLHGAPFALVPDRETYRFYPHGIPPNTQFAGLGPAVYLLIPARDPLPGIDLHAPGVHLLRSRDEPNWQARPRQAVFEAPFASYPPQSPRRAVRVGPPRRVWNAPARFGRAPSPTGPAASAPLDDREHKRMVRVAKDGMRARFEAELKARGVKPPKPRLGVGGWMSHPLVRMIAGIVVLVIFIAVFHRQLQPLWSGFRRLH